MMRARPGSMLLLALGVGGLVVGSVTSGAWSSPAAEPVDPVLLLTSTTVAATGPGRPESVATVVPGDPPAAGAAATSVESTLPSDVIELVADVDERAVRQPGATEVDLGDVPTVAPDTVTAPTPTGAAPTTVTPTTVAPTTVAPTTAPTTAAATTSVPATVVTTVVTTDAPPTTPAPPPPSGGTSAEVVALANAERAAAGLAPLIAHAAVEQAALAHSIDQAQMNAMSHTGSDGSDGGTRLTRAGYSWSTWGENVAAGYGSAASVTAGWMGSPGHRANILNPSFVHVGVAVAYAADGTSYWTMVLAA